MIHFKTKEEIGAMREGGRILAEVLSELLHQINPGVSELELDRLAEELTKKRGAQPGFKRVRGYHHSLCVSVNDVVVHGIPTEYRFRETDIVGIDCGVYYKGFNTDMAETVLVVPRSGKSDKKNFLETGKKALKEAIEMAKVGNRIGHISKTIQDIVEGAGYSIVRSLVGHGVGRQLHEEPEVPGFLSGSIRSTPLLREGMVIAIEVIYNQKQPEVVLDKDGWTILTKDGSFSGLFERTVAITRDGPIVLTK